MFDMYIVAIKHEVDRQTGEVIGRQTDKQTEKNIIPDNVGYNKVILQRKRASYCN